MEFYVVFFIIILIITIIYLLSVIKYQKRINQYNNYLKHNLYSKKDFLTNTERYFYNILIELEKECNIKIHPQLNLASVIYKNYQKKYYNDLYRNIDFAIFTKEYEKLLLLIEINDKTHNLYKRKIRDEKVDKIVNLAGIRLIKFYTNKPNTAKYIKNRIKKELNILQ